MAAALWRTEPWRNALVVMLLILAGLSEGLGILTLLPMLGVLMHEGPVAPTGVAATFKAALGSVGLEPQVGVLLGLILVLVILKGVMVLVAMRHMGCTVARMVGMLRVDLIQALMKAKWGFYVAKPAGAVANSLGTEAQLTSVAFTKTFSLFADTAQVVVYMAAALLVSWKITLAAAVVGGVSAVALSGLVRMAVTAVMQRSVLLKSLSTRIVDGIQGIKPLRAMARESLVAPLLQSDAQQLEKAERDYITSNSGLSAIQESIMAVTLTVGMYLALTMWRVEMDILMVFGVLFWRTVNRTAMLQRSYQDACAYQHHFWNIREEIDAARACREVISAKAVPSLTSRLALEDVTFRYGDKVVLDGVSLTMPAGRITAIIGPSGAGKTTIADLVTGLILPQQGRVLVDDLALADTDLRAWREMIGYVPQETMLFHTNLLVNITLGDPHLTTGDVESALKAAGAWEFVSALPEGVHTFAGERGGKLSGGQRQRIALARALVRKPQLLILDEATTALDPATEAEILATLRELKGAVTILAISHQPALVKAADVVYWVSHGKAVPQERGQDAHSHGRLP